MRKFVDITRAIEAFNAGDNVTEVLRKKNAISLNTTEIIEIAYDLQAGSYVKAAEDNRASLMKYADECVELLKEYLSPEDTLLDVGTGEITTLSLVVNGLPTKPKHIYAFDISWSRLFRGLDYARSNMGNSFSRFTPFVAEMAEIPLVDNAANVTISSHALEPNGGRLPELLAELFRVTRDTLLLFEPCYELNSDEGKRRMDRLGYIKEVDQAVENLEGELIDKIEIQNISNPLNPTVCFVVRPPAGTQAETDDSRVISIPGSNQILEKREDVYFSKETGLCFPILKGIPILKRDSAILATALSTI